MILQIVIFLQWCGGIRAKGHAPWSDCQGAPREKNDNFDQTVKDLTIIFS